MAHFNVTLEEAIAAVRKSYDLHEAVEVQISNLQSTSADADDWHYVPSIWKNSYAPPAAEALGEIEVVRRNGDIGFGYHSDWTNVWSQDDNVCDIVKYRKAR